MKLFNYGLSDNDVTGSLLTLHRYATLRGVVGRPHTFLYEVDASNQ